MSKVSEKSKYRNVIIFTIIFIIGLLIAWKTGFINFIKDTDAMQQYFRSLGMVGYGIYIIFYILVAVFMLPASVMTIVAGIVFGPVAGAIIALCGATIGSCVTFLIARYVARDMIVNKFEKNPVFNKIEEGAKLNGTSFLILTRLVPVFPYNIQNYAYGLTSIKFRTYAIVTFICMAPGAFIYAFMAGEIVKNGVSTKLLVQFLIAGVVLFIVSLIPKYIAKKKGIEIQK